jgi:hypothetical protein
LNQSDRQGEVAEGHQDLVSGMPLQFGKLVQAIEKIQHEQDNAEQFNAATDKAVA